MDIRKYEELIKLAANPDKAPEALTSIIETIKSDAATFDALSKSNKELDGRIRDLQDTNTKLLLSQLGNKEETKEEEPPKVKTLGEIATEL